jgi:hypothetical protein
MPHTFPCFLDQNKFPISFFNSQAENQESWNPLRKRSLAPVSYYLPLFVDMPSDMAMSSPYIAQQPTDKSCLAVIEAVNTGIEERLQTGRSGDLPPQGGLIVHSNSMERDFLMEDGSYKSAVQPITMILTIL